MTQIKVIHLLASGSDVQVRVENGYAGDFRIK